MDVTARVVYFSMEIGIDPNIPTYSGGLGILAGDTIKSFADNNINVVAVSLLYKKGYFYQKLDGGGNQQELPCNWEVDDFLKLLPNKADVTIEGRRVVIQAWYYEVVGQGGRVVPILFLDTDIGENNDYDRSLSHYLYGGDERYRLAQEMVLGIGGIRMLRELGFNQLVRFHMNEGHSSLLTLELLKERKKKDSGSWEIEKVRKTCIFTTHTPVPAGQDKFSYDLVGRLMGDYIPIDFLKEVGGSDRLNMTLLALNLSHYENGVAKEHQRVSLQMFPGYKIESITNGVHSATWACDSFKSLYDRYIPGWKSDPFSLRYALNIPREEFWSTHQEAKDILINLINKETNAGFDHHTLTIGFARRATAYKRADLVFYDTGRLVDICKKTGRIQFVFSGKAHPNDGQGKDLIRKIVAISNQLKNDIKIVYLDNYDMLSAKFIVSGVDLWLNTPQKPYEASGTSGMKAAHNGIPSFSILDGWWIEGCIEDFTGWSIGSPLDAECNDKDNADSLYDKLEKIIIPKFYNDRDRWIDIMRHTVAINASFFNTHRMVQQYVLNAYLH